MERHVPQIHANQDRSSLKMAPVSTVRNIPKKVMMANSAYLKYVMIDRSSQLMEFVKTVLNLKEHRMKDMNVIRIGVLLHRNFWMMVHVKIVQHIQKLLLMDKIVSLTNVVNSTN